MKYTYFYIISVLALISFYIYYTNRREQFTNNSKMLKVIKPDYNLNKYHPIGIKVENLKRSENFKGSSHTKKELMKQYDYDTLIYNVFLSYNNKNLVLIGPPLFNFYETFFPLHFEGFGMNLKIQKDNNERYSFEEHQFFFRVLIPLKGYRVKDMNNISLIFKNKEQIDIEIPKNKYKCGSRILVTKQKDNKKIWLKDWITHYQERYKVSNIIIFDNNSNNTNELCNELNKDITNIIPYRYNFGVPKLHHTSFFQNTILEIAKLQFCRNQVLFFNFDIDELLQIIPTKLNTLVEKNKGNVNFNFKEWRVPMTIDANKNPDYSFKNFKYKQTKPSQNGYATKYVATIQDNEKTKLGIHFVTSNKKQTYLEDHFLHYNGINTNWKHNRTNLEKPDDTKGLLII